MYSGGGKEEKWTPACSHVVGESFVNSPQVQIVLSPEQIMQLHPWQ